MNSRDLANLHRHTDGVPVLSRVKDVCRACRFGNAQNLPFHDHLERVETFGDVVHSDINGTLVS